jgi:hypothetical protein
MSLESLGAALQTHSVERKRLARKTVSVFPSTRRRGCLRLVHRGALHTPHKRLLRLVQVLILAGCCACPQRKDADNPNDPPPEKAPTPFNARMGLKEHPPSIRLKIGEDCSQYDGNDACVTGSVCLRVKPGIPPKAFCSIRCSPQGTALCPDGPTTSWACRQIWPSDQGWFCVPDLQWTGGRATYKGGSVPLPTPQVAPTRTDSGVPRPLGQAGKPDINIPFFRGAEFKMAPTKASKPFLFGNPGGE